MNYGDHNFIEITQQTKLRVALVVSSEWISAVRQCRHSQNAWARHVERRVESRRVEPSATCFVQKHHSYNCKRIVTVKEMDFLYILIFLRDNTHFARLLTLRSPGG